MTEAQWEKDLRSGGELFILMVGGDWPGTLGLAQLNLAIELKKSIVCIVNGDVPTPVEFLAYDGEKLEVPSATTGEQLAKLVRSASGSERKRFATTTSLSSQAAVL